MSCVLFVSILCVMVLDVVILVMVSASSMDRFYVVQIMLTLCRSSVFRMWFVLFGLMANLISCYILGCMCGVVVSVDVIVLEHVCVSFLVFSSMFLN